MRGRPAAVVATILPLALAMAAAACDDPGALIDPPDAPRKLVVHAALDPALDRQCVVVEPADDGETIDSVRVRIDGSDGSSVSAVASPDDDLLDLHGCMFAPGAVRRPALLRLDFVARHGHTYQIEVSADGYDTVTGATTVPGDFAVVDRIVAGEKPGTEQLSARWTGSDGAFRYLLIVRVEHPSCQSVIGGDSCPSGWVAEVPDTVLDTRVPPGHLTQDPGHPDARWLFTVNALDRALYEYLTTGAGGDLFTVPPVQNVVGGYGVFGSWVRCVEYIPHAPSFNLSGASPALCPGAV